MTDRIEPELDRAERPVPRHGLADGFDAGVTHFAVDQPEMRQRGVFFQSRRQILGAGVGDVVPAQRKDLEAFVLREPPGDALDAFQRRSVSAQPQQHVNGTDQRQGWGL